MLPSDLQYLTDEDIEEIGMVILALPMPGHRCTVVDVPLLPLVGGTLTRVEKKRLQAAVQATRGALLNALSREQLSRSSLYLLAHD